MLKIRLQRTGKRGQAYFRVIIVEHTKKPKGKFLELLGNYDPHKKEFKVNMERVNHWVSNGAQVSPTVNNLLVNYKYWNKPKMPSWKPKKTTETQKKTESTETNHRSMGTQQENTEVKTTNAPINEKPAEKPKREEVPRPLPEATADEAAEPQPES